MTRLAERPPGAARSRIAARCAIAASAAALAAACGSTPASQPPGTSATTGPAATSPAAPGPGTSSAEQARRIAAARYLAIARPANRRLDHDFDSFGDSSRDNLAAAKADLRDAAATERKFDRQLLALRLPTAAEAVARVMVTANQARVQLTETAARSGSLTALHRYAPLLTAANAAVEDAVRVIRDQLGLPPPQTS
jgi:hypothetical protein